jgi:hypothetical protein
MAVSDWAAWQGLNKREGYVVLRRQDPALEGAWMAGEVILEESI